MLRTQFFKRSSLKAVCAIVLASSLALGGQTGARPNACTWSHAYFPYTIYIFGVPFPALYDAGWVCL